MITAELKEIERLVILNNGYNSFDTWGGDVRSMLYFYLVNNFKVKKINYFEGDKGDYIVYFHSEYPSHGGMDMGSPDSMIVESVKKYNKFER